MATNLSLYIKSMRKQYRLTQEDLAEKAGVGLRFVRDLEQAMLSNGLNDKAASNIFDKFLKLYPQWEALIRSSFLPEDMQTAYWQLVKQRIQSLA